jgi:hypothetical protein
LTFDFDQASTDHEGIGFAPFKSERPKMPSSPTIKRISLTLARSKDFPEGSRHHGYELVAPVDSSGRLNAELWKVNRADCTVRHFAEGQDDRTGMLLHKAGGAEHGRWVFDYDATTTSDDEGGYLFGSHRFVPGEYVSIQDERGRVTTFSVASVEELAAAS